MESSWTAGILQMNAQYLFKMLAAARLITQCPIPKDLNPQKEQCVVLTSCTCGVTADASHFVACLCMCAV